MERGAPYVLNGWCAILTKGVRGHALEPKYANPHMTFTTSLQLNFGDHFGFSQIFKLQTSLFLNAGFESFGKKESIFS